MSPQAEVVERKLLALTGYLAELRPKARLGLAAYRRNATVRRAVERLLQLSIESAADACAALLGQLGRPPAPTMRGEFEAAGEAGAVEPELARRLAAAAGLRNRLVHDYERLDDAAVLAAAREVLRDLPEFIVQVTAFLEGQTSEPDGD